MARHRDGGLACVLAVCALVLLGACTRTDLLFCEESADCTDPSRPFCDVAGAFPASSGIGKTCIADPSAEVDASLSCGMSTECGSAVPICEDGLCRGCTGDLECRGRSVAEPVCILDDGRCAECADATDCNGTTPVCDDSEFSCRACAAHDECGSEVCDFDTGACVPAANIVYVDLLTGADSPTCGAMSGASACASIAKANGGLPKISGSRSTLRVAAATYVEAVVINAVDVRIIGPGVTVDTQFVPGQAPLTVSGGADVTIDGVGFEGATATPGIVCTASSSIDARRVTITGNGTGGVSATDCDVAFSEATIGNHVLGLGITVSGGKLTLRRSVVVDNRGGGIDLTESQFDLSNNFIVRNGTTLVSEVSGFRATNSVAILASDQLLIHNTIVQNQGQAGSAGVNCDTKLAVVAPSNIVFDNGPSEQTGACGFSYSAFTGALDNNNNISTRPAFVAPEAMPGDFHLAAGSAGLDAGDPGGTVSVDFDGDLRPSGAGFDMGADER